MDQIESVLRALSAVAATLKEMTSKASQAVKDANLRAETVERKLDGMQDREDAVVLREKAAIALEQKYAGVGDVIVLQSKVSEDKAALENATRAFTREKSQRMAEIEQGEADNTSARLALKKDREALELEKKNYRQQIMDEIKKKVGG